MICCSLVQIPAQPGNLATTAPFDPARVSLNIGFRLPDESTQVITFVQRPLGLDFDKQAPMVVKKVQPATHAAEVGAREGWVVTSVDGEDLADREFEYIYGILRKKAGALEVPRLDEDRQVTRSSAGDEDVNAIQLRATLAKSSPGDEAAEEPACTVEEEAETREDLAKRVRRLEAVTAKQHAKVSKIFKELGSDVAALDAGMLLDSATLQSRMDALERSFEARRLATEELHAAAKFEVRKLASHAASPEDCKAPDTCKCP